MADWFSWKDNSSSCSIDKIMEPATLPSDRRVSRSDNLLSNVGVSISRMGFFIAGPSFSGLNSSGSSIWFAAGVFCAEAGTSIDGRILVDRDAAMSSCVVSSSSCSVSSTASSCAPPRFRFPVVTGVLKVRPSPSLFLLPEDRATDALVSLVLEADAGFAPDPTGVFRVEGRWESEDCGVLRDVCAGDGASVVLVDSGGGSGGAAPKLKLNPAFGNGRDLHSC